MTGGLSALYDRACHQAVVVIVPVTSYSLDAQWCQPRQTLNFVTVLLPPFLMYLSCLQNKYDMLHVVTKTYVETQKRGAVFFTGRQDESNLPYNPPFLL